MQFAGTDNAFYDGSSSRGCSAGSWFATHIHEVRHGSVGLILRRSSIC